MAQSSSLLTWLQDAHAMERSLEEVLEKRVEQTKDHQDMHNKVQEHLTQTKHHREMVAEAIERLGGEVSKVKAGMGAMAGGIQGLMSDFTKDTLIKAAISDYTAEHFEIASYRSLIAAAKIEGDEKTVTMAEAILKDEEDMAAFLEDNLPLVVKSVMEETGQA